MKKWLTKLALKYLKKVQHDIDLDGKIYYLGRSYNICSISTYGTTDGDMELRLEAYSKKESKI